MNIIRRFLRIAKILHQMSNEKKTLPKKFPQYNIGKGSYGNPEIFSWKGGAKLEIGAYCSIAENVKIFLGGEHRTDWVTTYPFNSFWECAKSIKGHPTTKGDVIIGNDVWIGHGAVILSGVTIETGAVIGCSAVVAKNIPSYCIAGGNPAVVIKKRFAENIIERLLKSKWWELDEAFLEKHIPLLLSSKVEEFLKNIEAHQI